MTEVVTAIKISTNGTVTKLHEPSTFDGIRAIIDGYVELIRSADGRTLLWCDEDAKPLNLPANGVATALWWQLNPAAPRNDRLRGTIVVTGPMYDDSINPVPGDLAEQFATWRSPE